MVTHWKPASAFVYSVICLFDFVVFPSWVGLMRTDLLELIALIENASPIYQQQLIAAAYRPYTPYTLQGGGLFHLAFGALLTGSAIAKETVQRVHYGEKGAEFKRRKDDVPPDATVEKEKETD